MIVVYFAVMRSACRLVVELPLVRLAEPAAEHVLLVERLDDAHAGHALLERGERAADVLAQLEVRAGSTRAGTSSTP